MPRIAQPRRCNRCGNPGPFYWKNIGGSVWLYSPTGERHVCGGRPVGKVLAEDKPAPAPMPELPKPQENKDNDWRKFAEALKPEVPKPSEEKSVNFEELLKALRDYTDSRFADFREALIAELKPKVVINEIHLKLPDGAEKIIADAHPKFSRLLKQLNRKHNVMLVGPAGSGKTYAAEQVAGILG
jgi:SpoVK/Ycf46/Vps4 family AAA+-type ATPase